MTEGDIHGERGYEVPEVMVLTGNLSSEVHYGAKNLTISTREGHLSRYSKEALEVKSREMRFVEAPLVIGFEPMTPRRRLPPYAFAGLNLESRCFNHLHIMRMPQFFLRRIYGQLLGMRFGV